MITEVDINFEFGKRVTYLRKKKGYSQEDLAFRTGLNKNYISDIERGTRNPTLKAVSKIAKGLNMTIEELFKGIGGTYNL